MAAALDFLDRLIREKRQPSHVVFYDRARLAEENPLLRDRLGSGEPIFEEREAVLVHFDDEESERNFLKAIESTGSPLRSDRAAASYIWSERYFALKAQRLGPNLLAGEVLLSRTALPRFIRRARRLAGGFGADLGIEAILAGANQCTVIASFPCDSRKPVSYLMNLLLAQLLVRLGTRLGGCPYGIGTWNAPFIRRRYSGQALRDMQRIGISFFAPRANSAQDARYRYVPSRNHSISGRRHVSMTQMPTRGTSAGGLLGRTTEKAAKRG